MANCNYLYIIGLFFIGLNLSAQTYPDLSGMTYKEIQALPKWNILTEAEGLLDGDELKDVVVILESRDRITESRCEGCKKLPNKARIIAVLFSNNSSPKVSIQNNRFIARPNEGGKIRNLRPRIKIADNRLHIFYQYVGSSSVEYSFECRNNELVLVYAKYFAINDQEGMDVKDYDFIKGSLTIERMRSIKNSSVYSSDELFSKDVLDISHHKMKTLSDFKEMYSWEIIEYHKL